MPTPLQVLLLEHDPADAEQMLRALRESGFEPAARRVDGESEYLAALDPPPTLILADYSLPDFDAPRALKLLQERGLDIPLIIVSDPIGEERAVAAIRSGAADFVLKERLNQLGPSVVSALQLRAQRASGRIAEMPADGERLFRALIENGADAIVVLSAEGAVRYASPAATRMLGGDAAMWPGAAWFERVHPDDLPAVRQALSEVVRQPGDGRALTFRLRRQDGAWLWMEGSATILAHDPAVGAVVLNYRDITERKQAEALLREGDERYELVFQSAPIAINITRGTEITYANPAYLKLFGFSTLDQLKRFPPLELFTPEVRPQILENIQRRAKGLPVPSQYEAECLRRDGTRFPILMYLARVIFADGPALVGFIVDITERKQVEEALYESEQKYRLLVERIHDVIYAVDEQGLVTYMSPSVEAHTGYTPAELVGREFVPLIYPDDLPRVLADFVNSLGGQAEPQEYRVVDKAGAVHWVRSYAYPISKAGRVVGVQGVLNDITERMQAEEILRQRLAELEALHTVSAALREAQTHDQALPILLDATLAALDTDAGNISLYDAERGELRGSVDRGWFQRLEAGPIKAGEGIAGSVFAGGRPHLTSEFHTDPLVSAAARERIPPDWGGVCLPIHSGAITVGVMFVSVPHPRQITPEQVKLLESLAEMGGAALQRMSLHEQTERRLRYVTALSAIDRAISSNFDLQVSLAVLLDEASVQLGVDAAAVFLLDPGLLTLNLVSARGFRTRAFENVQLRLGEGYAGRAALERQTVYIPDLAAAQDTPRLAKALADEEFASCYAVPLVAKGQVKGVLEVFQRDPLAPGEEWVDFLESLARQAALAIDNAGLFEDLQRSNRELSMAYHATIEGWSRALDLRDRETEGHTRRVTDLAIRLARTFGLSEGELAHVRWGALLHDIGKMGVPDSILLKPGPLTDEEWVVMKRHPTFAHELLLPIAYLRQSLDIPYCHHEKWDSTGYPRGLKGDQIPLAARIFAVVDVWDALRSDRPYRPAWTEDQVRAYIRSLSGTHFDPEVVARFMQMIDQD